MLFEVTILSKYFSTLSTLVLLWVVYLHMPNVVKVAGGIGRRKFRILWFWQLNTFWGTDSWYHRYIQQQQQQNARTWHNIVNSPWFTIFVNSASSRSPPRVVMVSEEASRYATLCVFARSWDWKMSDMLSCHSNTCSRRLRSSFWEPSCTCESPPLSWGMCHIGQSQKRSRTNSSPDVMVVFPYRPAAFNNSRRTHTYVIAMTRIVQTVSNAAYVAW